MKTRTMMDVHVKTYGHASCVAAALARQLREEGWTEVGQFWSVILRSKAPVLEELTAVAPGSNVMMPQKWTPRWVMKIAMTNRWASVEERIERINESVDDQEARAYNLCSARLAGA
jgi:hypothetical protein